MSAALANCSAISNAIFRALRHLTIRNSVLTKEIAFSKRATLAPSSSSIKIVFDFISPFYRRILSKAQREW
jgi:hypothetical protein